MATDQNPGCLGFLFALLRKIGAKAAPSFPYRVRDDFLSPSEQSFYHVLMAALDGKAIVCPKVRLADLFFVLHPQENRTAFNRITQKHIDYLICTPGNMKPLFGIELDDSSHSRPDRHARDVFVEQVFAAAQLPLLRIPAQRSYSASGVLSQIQPYLQGAAPQSSPPVTASSSVITSSTLPPLCPKCGVPMVIRTVTRGERAGQRFYGCLHYPRCRQTQPLADFPPP